ncbi:unnamed protein product [Protopolystoma xenopodis]|uniref:Uncharacterized protein n=1 Tax=Protopolystoma xenopodis TaxID=117903 RepID=A0A448XL17_9PLAT|nr:unnamed protein product [Protopolystoma xenopodis]
MVESLYSQRSDRLPFLLQSLHHLGHLRKPQFKFRFRSHEIAVSKMPHSLSGRLSGTKILNYLYAQHFCSSSDINNRRLIPPTEIGFRLACPDLSFRFFWKAKLRRALLTVWPSRSAAFLPLKPTCSPTKAQPCLSYRHPPASCCHQALPTPCICRSLTLAATLGPTYCPAGMLSARASASSAGPVQLE